jgi:hypothetical protein
MTERESDIDFDFFDDPPERPDDTAVDRPRPPIRRGGPPGRPPLRPTTGVTPLVRLAGLIAFAILIIVLLVFWIDSCQGASKKGKYRSYLTKVATIANDSEQVGRELNDALTTPGIKLAELDAKLNGLAQQEEQDVAQATRLEAPGPLRLHQLDLVEALQFRASGLTGLARAFKQASKNQKDITGGALLLAGQAERLVAADVIWDDLFKDPAISVLKRENVTGVAVPDSNFVPNPDFASPRFWEAILQRLFGTSTSGEPIGGLHGTGLVLTKALPSDQELSQSDENTVTATTDLGFAVTVEDTGDSQEVQVKVTLTIQQSPSPIVQTKTIDLINPGEQKTVLFRNLGQVQFATRTTVKVDIQPVPGEKNTSNNSAEYPVIFSLG